MHNWSLLSTPSIPMASSALLGERLTQLVVWQKLSQNSCSWKRIICHEKIGQMWGFAGKLMHKWSLWLYSHGSSALLREAQTTLSSPLLVSAANARDAFDAITSMQYNAIPCRALYWDAVSVVYLWRVLSSWLRNFLYVTKMWNCIAISETYICTL